MPNQTVKRIGILLESGQTGLEKYYFLNRIVDGWRAAGIDIVWFFGTKKYAPVDLLFVHIDRTEVSQKYLRFAEKFPVSINGRAQSIRKDLYCNHLLDRQSDWQGAVIVKTCTNYGGSGERQPHNLANRFRRRIETLEYRVRKKIPGVASSMLCKADYRIFDHLNQVPGHYFSNRYVVQKFCPEIRNGKYILREYFFFNEVSYNNVEADSASVFSSGSESLPELGEAPPAEVLQVRQKLNLDYGKIDYLQSTEGCLVLDANKTMGGTLPPSDLARALGLEFSKAVMETAPLNKTNS